MIRLLRILFTAIFLTIVFTTIWASLDKDVISGALIVAREPWGAATLVDAYLGFVTFYIWVFYKESAWPQRIAWFAAIMLLGNIAMSAYVLRLLFKLKDDASPADLLLRRTP